MLRSPSETEATIRRLELELEEIRRLAAARSTPQTAADSATPTTQLSVIINLIRNGDVNHSVNSWFESALSGTNKDDEAANIYTHTPSDPARVSDGNITTALPNRLNCPTSLPFLSTDVGERIVVSGADTDGAELVTTIATYISDGAVELTDAADLDADATNLTVRFRLQKLTKTNSKNFVGTTNDALKAEAHDDYATNINDPDWQKTSGNIRLGSLNTIDCPFGYYEYVQNDGTGNGTNFIALHSLFPGRTLFARINLARASVFVKPKGSFYFGIYNNHDAVLDYAYGLPFSLSENSGTIGTPSVSTTAQYLVIIETDQGYSVVSSILTLEDSPDDASFTSGVFNFLSWKAFAGALRYKIYRKLGSGNVFLLEGDSPTNTYEDRNPAARIDTGSPNFPNPANARPAVSAYVSMSDGDLTDLPINGVADWTSLAVIIPFPSSINLGQFFDPHLRFGLTEAPAIELTDVVTDATTTVTSAVAQFTEAMEGKAFILTDPNDDTHTLEGTIDTYISPTEITLSDAATWTATGNVLEIAESAPHGILIDLIGAAQIEGEWAAHNEDTSGRPQTVVSNPNGSTQGGVIGDGGGVIIRGPGRVDPGELVT